MKLAAPALLMLAATASAQTPDEPYRALGTEPFWALTIDGRTMRLDEPGVPPLTVSAPPPRPSFNGRRYVTRRMMVDINAAPCSDGMSDRRYPERVTVMVGRRTLRGCGGLPIGDAPVAGTRLEGAPWAIAIIGGRPVTHEGAEMRFEGGRLTGSAGCNRFSAHYTLNRGTLRVGFVRATRMACPEPAMTAENRVLAILAQPMRVRLTGRRTVMLVTEGGGITLRRR
jgi:heat shock protein HslJ/uncharacterized membrane protein